MVSMYLILTFQDINDKTRYIEIVYGTITVYGISTLVVIDLYLAKFQKKWDSVSYP